MLCELCGIDKPFLKPVLVEGSLLKVCSECAKFGKAMAPAPGTGAGAGTGTSTGTGAGSRIGTGAGSRPRYGLEPPSKEEMIRQRLEQRERRRKTRDIFEGSGEKELALDYHIRIQRARSDLGWNQEQLGQKINERKSVISKIENKSMKPDDKLVRKLEKALNIKLMEVLEEK